jgi:hypothetical protein
LNAREGHSKSSKVEHQKWKKLKSNFIILIWFWCETLELKLKLSKEVSHQG